MALEVANTPTFDALISAGADLDARFGSLQKTSLHYAIQECHFVITKDERHRLRDYACKLIKTGADVNATTHPAEGCTPLILVIDAAQFDWQSSWCEMKMILELLIKYSA